MDGNRLERWKIEVLVFTFSLPGMSAMLVGGLLMWVYLPWVCGAIVLSALLREFLDGVRRRHL